MASKIEWLNLDDGLKSATLNAVVGCLPKSPGCKNCYAMKQAARCAGFGTEKYFGLTEPSNLGDVWTGRVAFDEGPILKALKWRDPRRCFLNSMGDLFHAEVPEDWIDITCALAALCPDSEFIILTKDHERQRDYFNDPETPRRIDSYVSHYALEHCDPHARTSNDLRARALAVEGEIWPLPNLIVGVSIENQDWADKRVPVLQETLADRRIVSVEPQLEGIDISRYIEIRIHSHPSLYEVNIERNLDGVLIGGESGPGARIFDLAWPRRVVALGRAAGIPVFVKQLGANPVENGRLLKLSDAKGGDPTEWPEDLRVREWPYRATDDSGQTTEAPRAWVRP